MTARKRAKMLRLKACLLAFGLLCAAVPSHAQQQPQSVETPEAADNQGNNVAVLQILNKTTAKVHTVVVPVNIPIKYESLNITARFCEKNGPLEPPEAGVFLDISEQTLDQELDNELFTGWMFASRPGLCTISHPVYDVVVLDCQTN